MIDDMWEDSREIREALYELYVEPVQSLGAWVVDFIILMWNRVFDR